MSFLRQATARDIPQMHHVRRSVYENTLTTTVITAEDTERKITQDGRGWVVEVEDEIAGFAIALRDTSELWALFVAPEHEGQGYGRRLHDAAVSWFWAEGAESIWLSTGEGTRAERIYQRLGWSRAGLMYDGEIMYELTRPC